MASVVFIGAVDAHGDFPLDQRAEIPNSACM